MKYFSIDQEKQSRWTLMLRRNLLPLSWAVLLSQILITVTGSIVRVTSSGLGCPTWPQCFPGSYIPQAHSEVPFWHQIIEFGNRQLAVWLVTITSILVVWAAMISPVSTIIKNLALCMPLGTVFQAILGGITVRTGLVWWTVMLHMLCSLVMIWLAAQLCAHVYHEKSVSFPAIPTLSIRKRLTFLSALAANCLALATIAGAFTTGAGPLAGDQSSDHPVVRLAYSIPKLITIHIIAVGAFVIALIILYRYCKKLYDIWEYMHKVLLATRITTIVQIGIGIIQTYLALPGILVVLHVLGACVCVGLLGYIYAAIRVMPILGDKVF